MGRNLDGELLLPHWRFDQGFDLKLYFETATETDLVMLFAGFALLVLWKHRANLGRLFRGAEPKVGRKAG